MWRKRLIIFLIRRKLGVKTYEKFKFVGQKCIATYYFTDINGIKNWRGGFEPSGVSLNWLLDDNCKITKVN